MAISTSSNLKVHPKLKRDAKKVFKDFLSKLPLGMRLDELNKTHFRMYIDKRFADKRKDGRDGSVKATTIQRELKYISAAINSASEYFSQCENWTPPKMISPQVPKEQVARIIEDDEWQKLLDYLLSLRFEKERQKDFIARRRVGLTFYFALLTGLRHGEICALEKQNFNLGKRRLRAERIKTQNSGIQWTNFEPLTDSHIWTLLEAEKLYPESPYFFSMQGKIHNRNYSILKEAAQKLGINYGKFNTNGFVFHSTRHTFATTLETSGIDRTTSRGFTAHTRDEMFARYAHTTIQSKAKAMLTVENKFTIQENKKMTLAEIFEKVQKKQLNFSEFEYEISKCFA